MQGGHKRVEAGPLVGVRKQALLSDGLQSRELLFSGSGKQQGLGMQDMA